MLAVVAAKSTPVLMIDTPGLAPMDSGQKRFGTRQHKLSYQVTGDVREA